MNLRRFKLKSGNKILLGKNAEQNEELMNNFKGKSNTILHTLAPGSPFGVLEELNPSKENIYEGGIVVARYSQDWRNKKKILR